MRSVLILLLMMSATVWLRAESQKEKLMVLGGLWSLQKDGGSIEICPFVDTRLWLNGRRLPTHDEQSFVVHEGDQVDEWEDTVCYRYRFDSISANGVVVTRTTFASVQQDLGANRTALRSGRLLKVEVIRADASELPALIWDNSNWVEMGPPGIYSSKRPN